MMPVFARQIRHGADYPQPVFTSDFGQEVDFPSVHCLSEYKVDDVTSGEFHLL